MENLKKDSFTPMVNDKYAFFDYSNNYEPVRNSGLTYEELGADVTNCLEDTIKQLDICIDNKSILPIQSNVYEFNSLKVLDKYVIIDIFRSSKYNSLVFICNNRNYIQEECKLDILSLKAEPYILKNIMPDLSNDYIEIDRFNVFKERYHHEIFYIENFPENISNLTISLNNIKYTINIPKTDTRFINSKCLTTIQKGEIHLIEPWIEWHKTLGVEYFFIYDNNFNVNNYSELFKKYSKELIVYNANFPYWLESYGKNSVGQCIQQSHTLWKFSPEFLGLTDLDEYIYPLSNFNIFDKNISVLSIPNRWFGCSGHNSFQKNILNSYTKRQVKGNIINYRKCIIQSSQVDLFCVHIALNYRGVYNRAEYSDLYLRHYYSLSNKKRPCNCSDYCVIEDIPRV